MLYDHPRTPQSPSQIATSMHDLPPKPPSPTTNNSLPTPAHSINGSMSSSTGSGFSSEVAQADGSSNKRKRDIEDHGDQEQKKVHVEDSRISIEDLHLNVGKKYLLCRTPHSSRPVPYTQDLFKEYSLDNIAGTVARIDATGAKKSLRKTYKNYLRDLKLTGSFDSVKKELGAPDTLFSMIQQPQEEWDAQYVRGKAIEQGIPQMTLANLGKAMTMARGIIPKDVWNPSVLGELAGPPAVVEQSKIGQTAGVRPSTVPQTSGLPRATAKADIPRPKRNVKKRAYGDASYEGYGEGFVDDDIQEAGYSTGEGDDRGGARKRPKKNVPNAHFQGPTRQSSYGPGMVGA